MFLIDVLLGANCGSRRTLLAAIHEPDGIRRILDQLGLPADPPELARARSPPEQWRPW
ncbi:MAG: ATP-dependent helicase HrpA [Planctomycetes bacterium]|nr:ATP-dependent helicase HrpA [Planctomycetota bacterium]